MFPLHCIYFHLRDFFEVHLVSFILSKLTCNTNKDCHIISKLTKNWVSIFSYTSHFELKNVTILQIYRGWKSTYFNQIKKHGILFIWSQWFKKCIVCHTMYVWCFLKGFSEMSKPNNCLFISTFKLKININKNLLVNFTV